MGSNSSMITVLFRKFNPPRNGSLLGNFGNRLEWVALNNREMGIYIYIYTQILVIKVVIVEINSLRGG